MKKHVLGALLTSLWLQPTVAGKMSRFMQAMADRAEEAAIAKDQEMRALIGPNYEAAAEVAISASSREAAANIDPRSLRRTQHNGMLAELVGTDRDRGTPQSAAVGDVAYAVFSYFVRPTYRMVQTFDWLPAADQHYLVPKDTPIELSEYGEGICTRDRMGSLNGKPKKRVCFRDADNDLAFDTVTGIIRFEDRRTIAPLSYRIAATAIVASKFRRELVYLGRTADTLRFQYREFQTNLIRPAFTSEMTYSIERVGPIQIRYQKIRIEIQSITNDGIRYLIKD